ncbi:probable galacturonosyltransferase 7 isoform X2 [Tanacetum coccineum]
MSDNIPFDIQMEIIKKVSSVKSLIQFRSVSKPWKSFIDSSEFIKGYGARHTYPHSHILSYISDALYEGESKYICLVDDDIETFKVQQEDFAPFVVSPLLKYCYFWDPCGVIGACHGLLCLFGCYQYEYTLVIWNPSIGKSFGIEIPIDDSKTLYETSFGFGVCPVTSDPTVVKFVLPWHVEVFTLSSGVWNVIPSGNLPRQTIRLETSTQVVIGKFIYWGASEKTNVDHGESTINHMVVSFDLVTKGFKMVNLPDALKKAPIPFSVSKLRGSLVVCGYFTHEAASLWLMENDSSFTKLFTIRAPRVDQILGFKKNGETIFKTRDRNEAVALDVYDPCSQQIKNLGISVAGRSFFTDSYKESLLLLDHLDSHIYFRQ